MGNIGGPFPPAGTTHRATGSQESVQARVPALSGDLPVTTRNPQRRPFRIALAGGGTGGHLVPGLHLLDWAYAQGTPPDHVLWLTAGRPVETRVLGDLSARYPGVAIDPFVLPLENPSGGPPSTAALLRRTPRATALARKALAFHGSQVLLGLGGFTALPSVLAARRLRLPVALYEVNTVAGRATRWLAFGAREVLHAWPDSLPSSARSSDQPSASGSEAPGTPHAPGSARTSKHRAIGPVVGPAYAPLLDSAGLAPLKLSLGLDPERPLLCVLGGSQGAGAVNRFVASHAQLWITAGWQVLHQVGPGRLAEAGTPMPHYHPCEYLGAMAEVLRATQLVLGRGGASSLAEVGATCTPCWVIPYPHHADRHQWRNAERLGPGARVIEESALDAKVAQEVADLLLDPLQTRWHAMRTALLEQRSPNGAEALWQSLQRLAMRTPALA